MPSNNAAGRPTYLTPELSKQICDLIALGVPINDVCTDARISTRSFYGWRAVGRKIAEMQEQHPDTLFDEESRRYLQFFHDTTRAQAQGRIAAVAAVRSAIQGGEEKTITLETHKETRLRKIRRIVIEIIDGVETEVVYEEQEPYEHKTTTRRVSTTTQAPDARMALEYLARRDPENWAKRQWVEQAWREKAIAQIRAGVLDFEYLAELFDQEEATELWIEAGMEIPLLGGGTNDEEV